MRHVKLVQNTAKAYMCNNSAQFLLFVTVHILNAPNSRTRLFRILKSPSILKSSFTILVLSATRLKMSSIPNMVIDGSLFLGNEMTYLRLFQDALTLASYVALSWNLYWKRNPTGISSTSQILYALTFTLRLTEHYPFDHFSYDFASSLTFAVLFWISLISLDFATNRLSADAITMTSSKDRLCLHTAIGGTAILASFINYNHLPFSGPVFCHAWSHYLNGVAVLPQLWALFHLPQFPPARKANNELLSLKLFSGVNLMSMARIFEMLHWTYMKYEADMFDPLAYYSALFHLGCMLLFRLIYAYKRAGNFLLA